MPPMPEFDPLKEQYRIGFNEGVKEGREQERVRLVGFRQATRRLIGWSVCVAAIAALLLARTVRRDGNILAGER